MIWSSVSMYCKQRELRSGTSLIDVVVSLAIISILFAGIYLIYFSLLDALSSFEARRAAVSALNQRIELIRNLPYDSVGTVGGVPSGVLPQNQTSTVGDFTFSIKTTIRNIDDPFDGTIGGNPNDTAPADYKLVELEITCPTCARFASFVMTTTVAPPALENTSQTGSLFINVFDSLGNPVGDADVSVSNASVTPAISLQDTTNASGALQLVGIATATQSYQIIVSKSGYSSERTYRPGLTANPNPLKSDATVAVQALTSISFAIDRVSSISFSTSNMFCSPIANQTISLSGSKLLGTNPDVLKFSTTTVTNASGNATLSGLEWDTYSASSTSATYDVLGLTPIFPLTINPSSTIDARFVLVPADRPALTVSVFDSLTGLPVSGADVTLSRSGYSETLITGHNYINQTTWINNNYGSQSGGIDGETIPGTLRLASSDGAYPTSTTEWLISSTFDMGSSSALFYHLDWNPVSQPAQTVVKFQLAGNNDDASWNFVGPDGTSATFYTASSTITNFGNYRYFRYKIYFSTQNSFVTPSVDDVSVEFGGSCVPNGTVLFSGLNTASYTATVNASGYNQATSSVSVGAHWQNISIPLTSQ